MWFSSIPAIFVKLFTIHLYHHCEQHARPIVSMYEVLMITTTESWEQLTLSTCYQKAQEHYPQGYILETAKWCEVG